MCWGHSKTWEDRYVSREREEQVILCVSVLRQRALLGSSCGFRPLVRLSACRTSKVIDTKSLVHLEPLDGDHFFLRLKIGLLSGGQSDQHIYNIYIYLNVIYICIYRHYIFGCVTHGHV